MKMPDHPSKGSTFAKKKKGGFLGLGGFGLGKVDDANDTDTNQTTNTTPW